MPTPASDLEERQALPARPGDATLPAIPLQRLAVMGSIVSAILLVVNGFVCATWSHFFGLPGWLAWQVFPGALAVAFILTTIFGFRYSNPPLRLIYAVSAVWLGVLDLAFFAALVCWIVAIPDWLTGWPVPRFDLATIFFGLALLIALYGFINAAWIRVTQVTVQLPNLPEAWQGHTVALVTDLHLGHLSGPTFLRRVLSRLRSLQPDAVLISGDMFDGTTIGLNHLVAPWSEYSAPRGIFFVTGNHDEFAEREIYLDAVKRTGIHILNNEKISVDGLTLVGVHDSEAEDPVELRNILRHAQLDPLHPSILLAHRPVNLSVAQEEGISLQVSGHTHGGQIWPWNLLVSRIYGKFAHGLNRLGKLQVYTSYGVGTWGPPLRVATHSELVLIRLEKAMTTD